MGNGIREIRTLIECAVVYYAMYDALFVTCITTSNTCVCHNAYCEYHAPNRANDVCAG